MAKKKTTKTLSDIQIAKLFCSQGNQASLNKDRIIITRNNKTIADLCLNQARRFIEKP